MTVAAGIYVCSKQELPFKNNGHTLSLRGLAKLWKHQQHLNFWQELKAFVLANRPLSKMAAENLNRSILKTIPALEGTPLL